MAWFCLRDNALSGSKMCIVTGPRTDSAIALIDRMKKLFAYSGSSKSLVIPTFDTKETVIELNNVKWQERIDLHHYQFFCFLWVEKLSQIRLVCI
jgi:hypothetical protein